MRAWEWKQLWFYKNIMHTRNKKKINKQSIIHLRSYPNFAIAITFSGIYFSLSLSSFYNSTESDINQKRNKTTRMIENLIRRKLQIASLAIFYWTFLDADAVKRIGNVYNWQKKWNWSDDNDREQKERKAIPKSVENIVDKKTTYIRHVKRITCYWEDWRRCIYMYANIYVLQIMRVYSFRVFS